jgi:hypothetical protein
VRIFDMNKEQLHENIVNKMFSSEGHIKKTISDLERLKRGDKDVSVQVLLPKFRLSYPSLDTPKSGTYNGQKLDPKYSAVAVFDPAESQALWPYWRVVYALCTKYLGKKAPAFVLNVNNGATLIKCNEDYLETQIEKGKDITNTQDVYLKGGSYLNLSRNAKFGPVLLVGKDRKVMDAATAKAEIYAGCYCQATVELFAMNSDKVAQRLLGVMKVGEGERLTGGAMGSVDAFSEVNILDPVDAGQGLGDLLGGDSGTQESGPSIDNLFDNLLG